MPRSPEDFANELQSHLDLETDRLIAEGLRPDEARRAARRTLGNLGQIRETRYRATRSVWLEHLRRDLGYSVRGLIARPAFTLTAVLTLGLGLGLNSALFSMMHGLLFRPLALPEAGRVVDVYQNQIAGGGRMTTGPWAWVSYPEYLRYREGGSDLLSLAAHRTEQTLLAGEPPIEIGAAAVSCNYFATLVMPMERGRALGPADCRAAGGEPVAVLGHRLWQTRFGADPAMIGKSVVVRGRLLTVVGIAPSGFHGLGLTKADLWVPVTMYPVLWPDRGGAGLLDRDNASWLAMVGRLRPGITRAQAQAALAVVGDRRVASDTGKRVQLIVAPGTMFSEPARRQATSVWFGALLGTSGFIILLVCTNLINLLLARGLARRREIAVRLTLGASRATVIRQLMIEALLVALGGGVVGGALMLWVPSRLAALGGPSLSGVTFAPSLMVLGYGLGLMVVAAIGFGLLPALGSTRLDLAAGLREGDARSGTFAARRTRHALVAVQVAGSAVFVALAAASLGSLRDSLATNPGFSVDQVATVSLSTQELGYDDVRTEAIHTRLLETLRGRGDVATVALTAYPPFSGRMTSDVFSRDQRRTAWATFHRVSPDFFATLNIPIERGRVFSEAELARATDAEPVVVSAALAKAFWPDQDPIGRELAEGYPDGDVGAGFLVVGVARDIRSVSLGESDQPSIYRGMPRSQSNGATVLVATRGGPASVLRDVPSLVRQIDPGLLVESSPLADRVADAVARIQLASRVTLALGGLALILALVGIVGVVTHGVTQRRREFGVRIALGATAGQILQSAARWGATAVAIGIAAGLALVLAASRLLAAMLQGFRPVGLADALVMVAVVGAAAVVALILPAWRATKLDVAKTLRVD